MRWEKQMQALVVCTLLLGVVIGDATAQEDEKIVQSGSQQVDLNRVEKINPPVVNAAGSGVTAGSELIVNPGFESGDMPPWYTTAWSVVTGDSHSGTYSAYDVGNNWIRQDFTGTPVSEIISVTFWSRQPEEAVQAVDFFYDDGTYTEDIVYPGATWQQFDVTSLLIPGKTLTGIRIWGYDGGGPAPDETYMDDISIQKVSQNPTILISTDKDSYVPGETIQLTLNISNPTTNTYKSNFLLNLFWPTGTGVGIVNKSFTMTPGFKLVKVIPYPIPNSIFVPDGDYYFKATLTYGGQFTSSNAYFTIKRP